MEKISVSGEFFDIEKNEAENESLVFGYNFKTWDDQPHLVGFKRWDKVQKCNHEVSCMLERAKVDLMDTDAHCGQHNVKLIIPKGHVRMICVKGTLTGEEAEKFNKSE